MHFISRVQTAADPTGATILGIPTGQLTLSGIALAAIAFIIIALLRGWLVPKNTHERELAQADKRADDYRELYETADKRATLLEDQIGKTVVKILSALPVPDNPPERGLSR
jgi:uncharacterized membrane protein